MKKKLFIITAISLTILLFQNCSPLGESNFSVETNSSELSSTPTDPPREPVEPIPEPVIAPTPDPQPELPPVVISQPQVTGISIINTVDPSNILSIKNGDIIDSSKLKDKKFKVYATVNDKSKLVSFEVNGTTNDEVNPPYTSTEFEITSSSTYVIQVTSFEDTEKSGLQSEPFNLSFSTKKEVIKPPTENEYSKDYLFFGGFEPKEGHPTSSTFDKSWGIWWKKTPASGSITNNSVESFEGQSLKIRYPGKTLAPHLRYNFASDFKKMGFDYRESAYLRYYVKFHKGWDWGISGKIPGLSARIPRSGGQYVDGTNGWSNRFVWHEGDKHKNAHAALYLYSYGINGVKKTKKYGYEIKFTDPETKKPLSYPIGEWVCLEQYVQLNEVGKYNGISKAWMNGKLAINENKIMFRTTVNQDTKVGRMMFSTFFGGGTDKWAPSHDVHASFDNFVISKNRIGCK